MNAPLPLAASPTLADFQRDMRQAYFDGGAGVLVSGLAWLAAALACHWYSPQQAVWTLFVGGALIHPVSMLLLKALGRRGNHTPANPLGPLAMATTFWMILSLPLAYAASLVHIEWFFPAMLFVIGGRYLCFATIYGMRLYWVFGVALALAGWALGSTRAEPFVAALSGSAIEIAFAAAILASAGKRSRS